MSKRQNRLDRVSKVPFKYLWTTTPASTTNTLALRPGSFPRVGEIADAFDLFRVSEMRYRLLPNASNATALNGHIAACAYYPGITDTAPAAAADIAENTTSVITGAGQSVPSQWCALKEPQIRGYPQWYKTVVGTPDPADEQPGSFYVNSTLTSGLVAVEIEGTFEFKGPVNTAATPAMKQQHALLREKARIVRVLATPSTETSGSPSALGAIKR